MIFVIISVFISIGALLAAVKGEKTEPAEKTGKLTKWMRIVLLISPLIAAAVFSVLFCTVLKGRFVERSSHALIVFCLWLYGTTFYVNILRFFKNKLLLFTNLIGMMFSIASAIILTPLDRYCALMFDTVHEATYLLGVFMLVSWFFSCLKYNGRKGSE